MSEPIVTDRYGATAIVLHWLVVILLVAQFAVAWTMPHVGRGSQPVGLIAWHLSIGIFVLLVVLLRLTWRVRHPVAPASTGLPDVLARVVHSLLYVLLIVLPLLGWTNADARWANWRFGFVALPALVPVGSAWGRQMGDVHQVVAWVLLGAIGLHVLAALFHQFVLRDGLLRRMWFH